MFQQGGMRPVVVAVLVLVPLALLAALFVAPEHLVGACMSAPTTVFSSCHYQALHYLHTMPSTPPALIAPARSSSQPTTGSSHGWPGSMLSGATLLCLKPQTSPRHTSVHQEDAV